MRSTDLLQELIRFNTVNPPGNEGPALEHIMSFLDPAGWDCKFLAKVPERPNLVARLKGVEPGPNLALISHVDTVPADPDIITAIVIIVTEPIAVRTIDIDPSFGKHQLISRQKQQVSLIQQIIEKIE